MEIHGKIIRIVDKTTVIIDLGKNHGITDDSIFSIIGSPEPVIDPFTEEELGLVSVVKAKVKAAQVHDKFTIASTKWTTTRLKFGESTLATQFRSLFEIEAVDEGELLVDSADLQPWKAKSERPVKVGDIVKVDITGSPTNKISDGENSAPPKEGDSGGEREEQKQT